MAGIETAMAVSIIRTRKGFVLRGAPSPGVEPPGASLPPVNRDCNPEGLLSCGRYHTAAGGVHVAVATRQGCDYD